MKRTCWLMIAVASTMLGWHGPGAGVAPDGFRQLIFVPAVADNLALLFEKFDTELVLCLEGERRGDDLYVTDFRMPHILVSETGRVRAASCRPSPRSLGTWHNHPAPRFRLARANPALLARNCYLSRTDIHDFVRRRGALVTVVACAPRTYAYWRRRDVDGGRQDVALLPAPPGQLVRAEAAGGRETAGFTQARRR